MSESRKTWNRHGHSSADKRSPTYNSWRAMKRRCFLPGSREYHFYGERGITVCDKWLSFPAFLADMGEKPKGHSLDRIDSNGNYEPGNCRWATQFVQTYNKRSTRHHSDGKEILPQREWEKRLGLSSGALSHRLRKGWPLKKALETPNLKYRRC